VEAVEVLHHNLAMKEAQDAHLAFVSMDWSQATVFYVKCNKYIVVIV
jgi:hypothetical protein